MPNKKRGLRPLLTISELCARVERHVTARSVRRTHVKRARPVYSDITDKTVTPKSEAIIYRQWLSVCNCASTFDQEVHSINGHKYNPKHQTMIFETAKDDPNQFATVILKLKLYKTCATLSVFSPKKTVAAGTISYWQLMLSLLYYRLSVESLMDYETMEPRHMVTNPQITLRNWVLAGNCGHALNLQLMYSRNIGVATYCPTDFPGLMYSIPDVCMVLFFDVGKFNICGLTALHYINDVLHRIAEVAIPCYTMIHGSSAGDRSAKRLSVYIAASENHTAN